MQILVGGLSLCLSVCIFAVTNKRIYYVQERTFVYRMYVIIQWHKGLVERDDDVQLDDDVQATPL